MLEWLEHVITTYLGEYGYQAVFVLMVLESACIPIPSEVTMVFGGFLVSRGDLNFWWVALLGTAANVVGSWLAYWVGLQHATVIRAAARRKAAADVAAGRGR
jgi:membrane protein DedA with SNARE-associated domain